MAYPTPAWYPAIRYDTKELKRELRVLDSQDSLAEKRHVGRSHQLTGTKDKGASN